MALPPSADILESFDTHHPLVLPDGGYQFQLGRAVTDSALGVELDKLNDFISTLSGSQSNAPVPSVTEEQKVQTNSSNTKKSRRLQNHGLITLLASESALAMLAKDI